MKGEELIDARMHALPVFLPGFHRKYKAIHDIVN